MLQVLPCLIFGMDRCDLQPSQQAMFCIPSIPLDSVVSVHKIFNIPPLKKIIKDLKFLLYLIMTRLRIRVDLATLNYKGENFATFVKYFLGKYIIEKKIWHSEGMALRLFCIEI